MVARQRGHAAASSRTSGTCRSSASFRAVPFWKSPTTPWSARISQTQLLNIDQVDPEVPHAIRQHPAEQPGELSGRECSRVQESLPDLTVGTCPALDACWGSGATVARCFGVLSRSSPGWTPTEVAATTAGTRAIMPVSSACNAGRAKGNHADFVRVLEDAD